MLRTAQETFQELTTRVAALITGDPAQAAGIAALYSEATHVSFPLAPATPPLRNRDDLQAHFANVAAGFAGSVTGLGTQNVRFHETGDPEVHVVEFEYAAHTPGGTLTLPNVFVMRIRDGEIVESRDYSAAV